MSEKNTNSKAQPASEPTEKPLTISVEQLLLGVVVSAVTALVLWQAGLIKGELQKGQVKLVARALIEEDGDSRNLLDAMAADGRFRAKDGRNGVDGIDVPIGAVVAWPGEIPAEGSLWHERWRVCKGGTHPIRPENDPLYAVLGELHGDAPQGYVALPDYRRYFLIGSGMQVIPPGAGGISHLEFDVTNQRTTGSPGGPTFHSVSGVRVREVDGDIDTANDTFDRQWSMETNESETWKGKRFDVRPPFKPVHWIIRVK